MTSRALWILKRIGRRVWFRASLFSALAVGTALLGIVLNPYIPDDLPTQIGSDAVDHILGILASSMLTATTFSLSTMVSAFSAATSNVTPRATKLVMEDSTSQNVLSTFVGSFLYSLVGIIVLSTGAYGERGRVVLFVVTVLVIVFIVVTLLRWMDHLSRLGRVTETTQLVEDAAIAAMRERRERPCLGAAPLRDPEREIPASARAVFATQVGYVQHIDVGALADAGRALAAEVYVLAIPGDFVTPQEPIAFVGGGSEEDGERLCGHFTIGDTRSFDQDPRFGVSVLTEIASRALSPAINDPGTAIDIIGRTVRVLGEWAAPADEAVEHPNVRVPPLRLADLFDDFFTPIARDGAAIVEIGVRLQKTFLTLSRFERDGYAENARRHSAEALERAEAALVIEDDKRRVRQLAAALGVAASGRAGAKGGRVDDGREG